MRRKTALSLLILAVLAALAAGAGAPSRVTAQAGDPVPAHLVLSVDNGSDARLNRMDWDVNGWAPLLPGTAARPNDYIELSGRTTVIVLCTDLKLLDQRGSESPRCDPYPVRPAFYYADDPAWTVPTGPAAVKVIAPDVTIPDGVADPGAYTLAVLSADDAAQVAAQVTAINGLTISPDAQAFALASFYQGQGMILDAIGTLIALPDLECSARRAFVEPPTGDARPLLKSPVIYLRLGEMFQVLGQAEDAARYYRCAGELAQALNDPANAALAFARQADIAADTAQAIQFYQIAIDHYTALGASGAANAMLELCGSRNCAIGQ